jgi:hypothetical protein
MSKSVKRHSESEVPAVSFVSWRNYVSEFCKFHSYCKAEPGVVRYCEFGRRLKNGLTISSDSERVERCDKRASGGRCGHEVTQTIARESR